MKETTRNQLPLHSLEYRDIRDSFVEYLKGSPLYKDYNFEASGISTVLNTLAYQAHLIGFYVKMLLDESFVDSAKTREALLSHAKRVGYIPKGKKAAIAELKLSIRVPQAQVPPSDSILIPAGTSFASTNNTQDTRQFQVISDVVASNKKIDGTDVIYTTPTIQVFEGKPKEWKFLVDGSVKNPIFVIKDDNVDVSTLRVFHRPNEHSAERLELKLSKDMGDVKSDAMCFYVSTNENGHYQIFFGNDVYGFQPKSGAIIECYYVSTSGSNGNGAKTFRFNAPSANPSIPEHVGNFSNFTVETTTTSGGGMEFETVEALRTTIPSFYRRQNRIVTENDFRDILLEEFRNIDSLNVWGGEKHHHKDYGKIYCSLKPRNNVALTQIAKDRIRDEIIKKYGIIGSDVVFVDPEYIDVNLGILVSMNTSLTNKSFGDVQKDITERVTKFSDEILNKFDARLSDLDLLNACRNNENWLTSLYTIKTISKETKILYRGTGINDVFFGNTLTLNQGDIVSSEFEYDKTKVFLSNIGDKIYILRSDTKEKFIEKSIGSIDAENGNVSFAFPQFATIPGYNGQAGILTITARPKFPDIETKLNNIVRIVSVKVAKK